jgi:hypothetical protein
VTSRRTHRLALLPVLGLLVAVGCEWRVTPIAAPALLLTCSVSDPVPPAFASGPVWSPPTSATTIRFGVVNSTVAEPIEVAWHHPVALPSPTTTPVPDPTQRVWDGTAATGFTFFASPGLFTVTLLTESGRPVSGDLSWTLTALDASGHDVGFLGCRPWPEPA